MADELKLESGESIELEDGSGNILLETDDGVPDGEGDSIFGEDRGRRGRR